MALAFRGRPGRATGTGDAAFKWSASTARALEGAVYLSSSSNVVYIYHCVCLSQRSLVSSSRSARSTKYWVRHGHGLRPNSLHLLACKVCSFLACLLANVRRDPYIGTRGEGERGGDRGEGREMGAEKGVGQQVPVPT